MYGVRRSLPPRCRAGPDAIHVVPAMRTFVVKQADSPYLNSIDRKGPASAPNRPLSLCGEKEAAAHGPVTLTLPLSWLAQ